MTREHKLALIIGLTLFLLVVGLLADHFSPAQSDRVDMNLAINDPLSTSSPLFTPPAPQYVATRTPPRPTPEYEPPAPRTRRSQPGRDRHGQPVAADANNDAQTDEDTQPTPDATLPANRFAASNYEQPSSSTRSPRLEDITEPVASSHQTRATPQAPRRAPDTTHTVLPNESLWEIADRAYGSGALWKKLRDYNADRVADDGTVTVGTVLRLPAKSALVAGATPAADPIAKPTPSPAQPSHTYTVKPGDDLGTIASKTLGSARRWRDIYELNKDLIDDPDLVPAGVTLKLPSR